MFLNSTLHLTPRLCTAADSPRADGVDVPCAQLLAVHTVLLLLLLPLLLLLLLTAHAVLLH
jgi:hypothetical protein